MDFLSNHVRQVATLYCKVCGTAILLLILLTPQIAAAEVSELQEDDCGKCHAFQLRMVAQDGGRHSTEVGCLDCHPQHPPKGENSITACDLCHAGEPHFQIGDCLHCHANPHKPLVSLRDSLKPERKACLSCHVEVGQRMTAAPSRHAQLFCNRCHSRHKEIPDCLDCHEPHISGQTVEDCSKCHPAHQPLLIAPTGYVPATFCRACHKKEFNDLADTKTNHGGINCDYCHKGRHPSTPVCQDCHGLPHTQSIHSQYRNCLECHGDAHRLISNR
jgi:hypothetical protein